MKLQYISLWLGLIVLSVTACYEEPDWLGDNTTPGAGNFPVISLFELTNGEEFAPGETAQMSLYYFSVDEIDRIVLFSIIDGNETEVQSFAYQPNFDETQQTDRLDMSYTVPAEVPGGTVITLKVEIFNKNGLTRSAEVTIRTPDTCPPGSIAGDYLATTIASTPFDGDYDNSASPYAVTISETGEENRFLVSDITGGLYAELYAPIYGVSALPGELVREGCNVSATNVPEDPVFQAQFGDNFLNATGTIDAEGVITYTFTNDAGDSGTVTLVRQ